MLRILTLVLILCTTFIVAQDLEKFNLYEPEMKWSPSGDYLLVSDFPNQKLLVVEGETKNIVAVADTLTGGQNATWSPDGNKVGFKVIQEKDGVRQQAAAIFDVTTQEISLLCGPASQVGNPAFSESGKIACTLGSEVRVWNKYKEEIARLALPHFANNIAISPSGDTILYNSPSSEICALDIQANTFRVLAQGEIFYSPEYSPSGNLISISQMGNGLLVIDKQGKEQVRLENVVDYEWQSEDHLNVLQANDETNIPSLVEYSFERSVENNTHTSGEYFQFTLHPETGNVFYFRDQQVWEKSLSTRDAEQVFCSLNTRSGYQLDCPSLFALAARAERGKKVFIKGVPYIHQVSCTKLSRAVACGATSATMAIAYYGKLEHWDFVAPSPFRHTSHYGNYITEKYTHNGVTFDKWGSGSSSPAYGGHGYVWQPPTDTKGHMAEFIRHHGVSSSVDWSPKWEELVSKVNSRNPFVILTSITSSGHYKTVVGYHENQHTVIVNDPYGNKNEGYGRFNGACVSYDWPGYNNGYVNLRTVHCFIYADSTAPSSLSGSSDSPIMISSFPYQDSNTTCTSNGSDVFDYYSSAPSTNEKGREIVYQFTVTRGGTFSAEVTCDQQADIDLHLLRSLSSQDCIVRHDKKIEQYISAGTYYLVCDTYVSGGQEKMGDYTVKCDFK